ncbi:MAG: hypothetical protein Q8L64_03410 [bacterium]|nr:hypothetical protein [bacterium]
MKKIILAAFAALIVLAGALVVVAPGHGDKRIAAPKGESLSKTKEQPRQEPKTVKVTVEGLSFAFKD